MFDRKPFNEWLFDGAATADAAVLVIAVVAARVLVAALVGGVGAGALTIIVPAVIQGLAGWVFLGATSWFAGTRLFGGSGDWQTVIRVQGLAYLPNILGAGAVLIGGVGAWLSVVGYLWYLAAATLGTAIALSLELKNAVLSVLTGAGILLLIDLLLQGTFTGIGSAFRTVIGLF